ncbi:Pseudaminic acid synthase [Rhodospirillaceae bacterium LM-1]|nr:Pseudaminic acid synthase [Rhodospirillaceae bacterium LM-1]
MIDFYFPDRAFVIAEMSGNHNQDLGRALRLIETAAECGADAIKLQTYTADTITIDHDSPEFMVDLPLWKGKKLYDLYQDAHTPWEWHGQLFDKAKTVGITMFSTPFDETSVDFLEQFDPPLYKIASSELVDIPLVKHVAGTGKPIIMSTGMASLEEIYDAVSSARMSGCRDLTLLHCVSAYPTPIEHANLATMCELARLFPDIRVGLSDHSLGTQVAQTAILLGATVIEKHLTLDRADGGVDSAFSLEPYELRHLCDLARSRRDKLQLTDAAIGVIDFEKAGESPGRAYRPSLYVVRNILAGESFSHDNVKSLRPARGLPPKEIDRIVGRTASCDISFGTPLSWDHVVA